MALDTLDRRLLTAAGVANDRIEARAREALRAIWRDVNLADYPAVEAALIAAMPALVDMFGDAAAEFGAQWYLALREGRGITDSLDVVAGAKPTAAELAVSARFATHSLYVSHDPANALTLAEGALQKHVMDMQRRTIIATTAQDRVSNGVRAGYGITAVPGACDWCSVKDTKGLAMYNTEQTARATFHDFCRCKVHPMVERYSRAGSAARVSSR